MAILQPNGRIRRQLSVQIHRSSSYILEPVETSPPPGICRSALSSWPTSSPRKFLPGFRAQRSAVTRHAGLRRVCGRYLFTARAFLINLLSVVPQSELFETHSLARSQCSVRLLRILEGIDDIGRPLRCQVVAVPSASLFVARSVDLPSPRVER